MTRLVSASPGRWRPPAATKPGRVAMLFTAGWANVSKGAKAEWQRARAAMSAAGVEVLDREGDDKVAAVEDAIANAMELSMNINAWEGRFPLDTYNRNMEASKLSESAHNRLKQALRMTQDEFAGLLAERDRVRSVLRDDPDHVDVRINPCRRPARRLKGSTGRATRCLRCLLLWWACRRSPCRFYRTKTCR